MAGENPNHTFPPFFDWDFFERKKEKLRERLKERRKKKKENAEERKMN